MFPARVRSGASRDARGNLHSDAELEPHVFKMRDVSSATNLKLVWMIDRRVNILVICSSMFKSLNVSNIRCGVQSALLFQQFTVTLVHSSLYHAVVQRTQMDAKANMC